MAKNNDATSKKTHLEGFNPIVAARGSSKYITENIDAFIKVMKNFATHSDPELFDFLDDIYHNLSGETKAKIYQAIIEEGHYKTEKEIDDELANYRLYINTHKTFHNYLKKYTIYDVCEAFERDEEGDLSHYVLAHYIKQYKCKVDSLFSNNDLRLLVVSIKRNDLEYVKEVALELKKIQDQVFLEAKEKKVNKAILKANTRLKQIYEKTDITYQELEYELSQLKEEVVQKLKQYIQEDQFSYFPKVVDFFEAIDHIPEEFKSQLYVPEVIDHPEKLKEEESRLLLVEDLFNQYHVYFKKSQIQTELEDTFIYFQRYADIKDENKEKRLEALAILLEDIHQSGKRNTESCRRLTSIINKEMEDLSQKEIILVEETKEPEIEEIVEPVILTKSSFKNNFGPVVQIGKTSVYKHSEKPCPIDLSNLANLLAPESRHQLRYLERLVFEIGYDKVQAYLRKAPGIYLEDLEAIIRVERQLRLEFQRILEDIEMYFRSSLTYYLSNKYDYVYLTPNEETFYKRGYLSKQLFVNGDEHYNHIHQLNERIDQEMRNNNQQVIAEFKQCKYSVSFMTAAGIMNFGWVMSIFDNLNYKDQNEYIKTYYQNISPYTFSSWMSSLTALRNRCAHYQSLYRIKSLRPILTKDSECNSYDDDQADHSTLFYYTIIMSRISPDVYNIEDFIDNIGVIFRKAKRDNYAFDLLTDYSFPKNWRVILENEKNSRIKMEY